MNYLECLILFVMYVPSMLGLLIIMVTINDIRCNVVRYTLIPMVIITLTTPLINMIGLMCLVSVCKDAINSKINKQRVKSYEI